MTSVNPLECLADEMRVPRKRSYLRAGIIMTEGDLLSVWDGVCHFVDSHMCEQKGVHLPGLGTFSFSERRLQLRETRRTLVLAASPIFQLLEQVAQAYHLQSGRMYTSGKIPVVKLNLTVVATSAGVARDVVDACVTELLQVFYRSLGAGSNVLLPFTRIGQLQVKKGVVKMRYTKPFLARLDGGDTLLQLLDKRPATAASVISLCSSSPSSPRPSSTSGRVMTVAKILECRVAEEDTMEQTKTAEPEAHRQPETKRDHGGVSGQERRGSTSGDRREGTTKSRFVKKEVCRPAEDSETCARRVSGPGEDGTCPSLAAGPGRAARQFCGGQKAGDASLRSTSLSGSVQRGGSGIQERTGLTSPQQTLEGGLEAADLEGGLEAANLEGGLEAVNLEGGFEAADLEGGLEAADLEGGLGAADLETRGRKRLTWSSQVDSPPPRPAQGPRPAAAPGGCGHPGPQPAVAPGGCGHKAGQELCYLCQQRHAGNLYISLDEETKQKDAEKKRLLELYNRLKNEDAFEQEQANLERQWRENRGVASYNWEVATVGRLLRRAQNTGPHPSYIFQKRPLTPPRWVQQQLYSEQLGRQVAATKLSRRRSAKLREHLERLQQLQLAEDVAAQREEYLRQKQAGAVGYSQALAAQVADRRACLKGCPGRPGHRCNPAVDCADPAEETLFGRPDSSSEQDAEKRRMAREELAEQLSAMRLKERRMREEKAQRQQQEAAMLSRIRKQRQSDEAWKHRAGRDDRLRLQAHWARTAEQKKQREQEESLRNQDPGLLVHEQCDGYRRCGRCQRRLDNQGTSNIWQDTRYQAGTRLIM